MERKLIKRQGDVYIYQILNPENLEYHSATPLKGVIAAKGEVTGHNHVFFGLEEDSKVLCLDQKAEENTILDADNLDLVTLKLTGKGVMVHEDHDPIIVKPENGESIYIQIEKQNEYDYFTKSLRRSMD